MFAGFETGESNEDRELVASVNPDALLANGFEDALIGVASQVGTGLHVAMYDRDKAIEILMSEGLTHEEAEEHFQYNVEGGWVGPNGPVFASFFPKEK
jgi:hypothetical protein